MDTAPDDALRDERSTVVVSLPSTDKVRFVDLGINEDRDTPPYVHTIEVSDERSRAHFITLFVTGPSKHMQMWIEAAGKENGVDLFTHDPETYHRDEGSVSWIKDGYFKHIRELSSRWHKHFHWTLEAPPDAETLRRILASLGEGVSEPMKDAILAHYSAAEAA